MRLRAILTAQDRRSQIRRAQRTYRQKKEITLQSLRTRVADLETTLQNVSDIFMNFQDAIAGSDLSLTLAPDGPVLLSDTVDRVLGEIENSGVSTGWQNQNSHESIGTPSGVVSRPFFKPINYLDRGLLDVFGYQVSHQVDDEDEACLVEDETERRQHVPSLLQSSIIESIFSGNANRRPNLQTGDRVDPRFVICALGRLRCLPDNVAGDYKKTRNQAVNRTHMPDLEAMLEGVMVSILGVDCENQGDQDWVDCRDVRSYLEEKGIVLDRSSVLVDIPVQTVMRIQGDSKVFSVDNTDFFLDMESFLNSEFFQSYSALTDCVGLVGNVKFLACAPGFRRVDIDAALKSAMRRRP